MDSKNNIIDFAARRKERMEAKPQQVQTPVNASIVDMTERRNEIINSERRRVRRTILTEFVGAFVVVPNQGLLKVSLYDISESGVAFDIEAQAGQFKQNEEVAFRVYMNQTTYFPFTVRISNIRHIPDEELYRHGARFVLGTVNEMALFHFVKFIETVSASLEKDGGDVMVSKIK